MLAGHVVAPYAAGAGVGRRVLFALIMLALGAWRGQREWRARADWNGTGVRRDHLLWSAASGAVAALLLAGVGYEVAHG